MKTSIIIFLIMFHTFSYSQSDYNLEDYEYDVDFHFTVDIDSIYIPHYSNGTKMFNVYSSSNERQCDSVINYHPNGKISAIGKLISYTVEFDTLMAEMIYTYWYRAKYYYENGVLAKSERATKKIHEYEIFSKEGLKLTEYKRGLNIIEYGCVYEELNIEIGKFKVYQKNILIGTVYFSKKNLKIIEIKMDNSKLLKKEFSVFLFDNEYYCIYPVAG